MLFFREAEAAERRSEADTIEAVAVGFGGKHLKTTIAQLRKD